MSRRPRRVIMCVLVTCLLLRIWPGESMELDKMLHDEKHPEAKIVDGRVVDNSAMAVPGEDTIDTEREAKYKEFKSNQAAGPGAAGPFFPATKKELEAAKNAPTDPERAKAEKSQESFMPFVPGYESILGNSAEWTGQSLLRGGSIGAK